MSVSVGDDAPDFELESHQGDRIRLSSFRGQQNVIIAFHPLAWTPVCASQMKNYEEDKVWFRQHNPRVLGLSVDAVPSKAAWAVDLGGITYDFLSDFHPHGAVAQAYGVAREDGLSERAIFIVDKHGTIVFKKIYDIPTLPDNADVRQAIEQLS